MTIIGLSRYVTGNFVERLQDLDPESADISKSISQSLSGSGASVNKISSSLRSGAQAYRTAIQGLNFAISFVNIGRGDLERLGKLTDTMIELADAATGENVSQQSRRRMTQSLHELGAEFQDIVEAGKTGDREYLNIEDLKDIFATLGLDADKSSSVQERFDAFSIVDGDDLMASEGSQGKRPVPVPSGAGKPRSSNDTDDLFSSSRTLMRRADAYAMLEDLGALRKQISTNLDALEGMTDLLGGSVELARAAGLAMIELSDSISDDAEAIDVARQLQKRIRADASGALRAQAEHLEPMLVAAYTLSQDALLG